MRPAARDWAGCLCLADISVPVRLQGICWRLHGLGR